MECTKCGANIGMTEKYFALSDVLSRNDPRDFVLCLDCASVVTPMDLYMSGVIRMANSDDDTIEANAVVVDAPPYMPTPEEIHSAEKTIEYCDDTDYDEFPSKEVAQAIRECDTIEEFAARYPGYEDYYEAAVEGK